MPGGVHAAQVVGAVGGGHQRGHLAVGPVEQRERVQPAHDDCHGLGHHANDGVVVHLHGLGLGRGPRGGQPRLVLEPLPVSRHHFVAQDGS